MQYHTMQAAKIFSSSEGQCTFCQKLWPPPVEYISVSGEISWVCRECTEASICVFCNASRANYKWRFESGEYMPVCEECIKEDKRYTADGDLCWFLHKRVIYMTSEGRPLLLKMLHSFGDRYQTTIDALQHWLVDYVSLPVPTVL